jgi:hypothetical protein
VDGLSVAASGPRNLCARRRTILSFTMAIPVTDLRELQGRVVLVKSAKDFHNPPAGRRGTIDVQSSDTNDRPIVRVVVDFPDMFTAPAHDRIITLDERRLQQLLASERNGAYELLLEDELS